MALEKGGLVETDRGRALVDALQVIVASEQARATRPGAPRARLDAAVTRWSLGVPLPTDVLGLVAAVRTPAQSETPDLPARQEVLDRVELVGVAAVARRQVSEALTDSLTGLPSRARLQDEVQRLIAASSRTRTSLTAVMLDVDGLKQINDEQGHAAGDAALAEVGRAINAHLRKADRAFRWGGDEFALFLPGATADETHAVVERIQRSCAAATSAGVATHSGVAGDTDVAAWLARADAELYAGRRERRPVPKVAGRRHRFVEAALLGLTAAVAASTGWYGVSAVSHTVGVPPSPGPAAQASAPRSAVVVASAPRPVEAPVGRGTHAPVRPEAVPAVRVQPAPVTVAHPAVRPAVVPDVTPVLTVPRPAAPVPAVPEPAPSAGLVRGLLDAVGGVLHALV